MGTTSLERSSGVFVQQHLARGLAAAEAAALATEQPAASGAETLLADAKDELAYALAAFDASVAQEHFAFGRARGWSVVYLGADTPLASVADAAHASAAVFAVVSAVTPKPFRAHRDEPRKLARRQRLCLGGAGAVGAELDLDAEILSGDPVGEAERVTSLLETR